LVKLYSANMFICAFGIMIKSVSKPACAETLVSSIPV